MLSLELLKLCDDAGVSREFYDKLTKTITKYTEPIGDTSPVTMSRLKTRETFTSALCKRYKTPEPEVVKVALETHFKEEDISRKQRLRDHAYVVRFDFKEQLLDLLSDTEIFGNKDNLCINNGIVERWEPYRPPDVQENLDEVFNGRWYQETVRVECTNRDGKQLFFMPITIYVDKTGTDAFQRHGVEPVVFTTPLIRRHVRNNPKAWRVLGFIPDLEAKSSAVKKKSTQSKRLMGMSCRNYHKCLSVVLESFSKCQMDENFVYNLRLGSYVRTCLLLVHRERAHRLKFNPPS